jgi:hypothetical protein
MKKLVLLSAAFLTTVSLLTSCGEEGTGNATEVSTPTASPEATVADSTVNGTGVVADTTKN